MKYCDGNMWGHEHGFSRMWFRICYRSVNNIRVVQANRKELERICGLILLFQCSFIPILGMNIFHLFMEYNFVNVNGYCGLIYIWKSLSMCMVFANKIFIFSLT